MTQEELLAKVDRKSEKIIGYCKPENIKDVKPLLDDIRNLANTIPVMPPKDIPPVHFCIDKSDVIDEYDMGACVVTKFKDGYEWRTKGGIRLYTQGNNESLCGALEGFFELRDSKEVKTEEQVEDENMVIQALTYILNLPMVVFSDQDFTIKIATEIVKWMNEKYAELTSEPLHEDDDPTATREMNEAVLAFEDLKNAEIEKIPVDEEE